MTPPPHHTSTVATYTSPIGSDVLANDTDADNLSGPANAGLTVKSVTQPAHGTAAFTATGVTYTPDANYYGSDSFTYVATDGTADSVAPTDTITEPHAHDPPATPHVDSGDLHVAHRI